MRYSLSLKLINNGKAFFGPGPARLLQLVRQGNSLHQAATALGMAYSKAWRIIREAEKELGFPLLTRQRGGAGGGGSVLTEGAHNLLARYEKMNDELYMCSDKLFKTHFKGLL